MALDVSGLALFARGVVVLGGLLADVVIISFGASLD